MPFVFEPLELATLRRRVADRIEDAILQGTLKEGERLVERRLASQFGTSLTVVREALIALEADGFVVKKPNAATYVTKLSQDAAKQIFDVRKVLEAFAVEEAARRATPALMAELERAYSDLVSAARSHQREAFLQADFALHEKIWSIADNEYLELALRRILIPIYAFSAIRIHSEEAFDLLTDAQSHLPVLEAIKANEPALARERFMRALEVWYSGVEAFLTSPTMVANSDSNPNGTA
jgi:DNA-binding GntR family transcriptional regulator